MILVQVTTNNEDEAFEIVDFLEESKLILDAQILNTIKVVRKDGKPYREKNYMVMAKTKSLLFNTIDEELRAKYGNNLPSLYSIPIVQMDWEQSRVLKDNTAKV